MTIYKKIGGGGLAVILGMSALTACSDDKKESKKDDEKPAASSATVPIETTFLDAAGAALAEGSATISFASKRPALDDCPANESKMEGLIAFPEGGGSTEDWEEFVAYFTEFDASFDLTLGRDFEGAGGSLLDPIGVAVIDGTIYVDMSDYMPLFETEPPYPPRWDERGAIHWVEMEADALDEMLLGDWNPDSLLMTYLLASFTTSPIEKVGTERLAGIATAHYVSTIASPFATEGDVPLDVWIDDAGRLAKVEFEADFKGPLDNCEAAGSAHAKTTFTMRISDYGTHNLDELELGEEPVSYSEFQEITGLPL